MTAVVWVTTRVPGFHLWPGAPERRRYLAAEHRHQFGFRVEVDVERDNRQVEFHDLLAVTHAALAELFDVSDEGVMFGARSCEMIARELGHMLTKVYPAVCVTVDEDGECGARVNVTRQEASDAG